MMNELVRQCIEQHQEGEKFFDALDEMVRQNDEIMFNLTIKMIDEMEEHRRSDFIVALSGRFGRAFELYLKTNFQGNLDRYGAVIICFEGGLRHSKQIQDSKIYEEIIFGHGYNKTIFIDDSLFEGRTRDTIKNLIESFGTTFHKTIVAYDGSKIKDENVISLYRYYDHH